MGFNPEQVKKLEDKLDPKYVKKRDGFDYIEGWHAIAEANRIFGHHAWDRVTELKMLGEPEQLEGQNNRTNWHVRYMAKSTISVVSADGDIVRRDGIGYGSGIMGDLGKAFEGAIKEAETDAMKRALMTFGNPFGLALYDKTKADVATPEDIERNRIITYVKQSDPDMAMLVKMNNALNTNYKSPEDVPIKHLRSLGKKIRDKHQTPKTPQKEAA